MKKTVPILFIFAIIFSIAGVMAQQNGLLSSIDTNKINEVQNKFQNKYMNQINCTGECNYFGYNNNVVYEERSYKRLFGMLFEQKTQYVLNNEGEVDSIKRNFWARLFNQNKIDFNSNI